jgi:hypothetical protein
MSKGMATILSASVLFSMIAGKCCLIVSVARRTTVRDSVNVVDDFYDIYG